MPLTGGDGNALTSAGLVQDPVETLRPTQHRLTPRLRKPWSTLASGRRLCCANSNQSEQLRSDLGILGGHYAGLSPALFRPASHVDSSISQAGDDGAGATFTAPRLSAAKPINSVSLDGSPCSSRGARAAGHSPAV
jgi:hypothetical protein